MDVWRKRNNGRALIATEKIVYEYSNNRNLLISKIEVLWLKFLKAHLKLINQFLLFNIHGLISH